MNKEFDENINKITEEQKAQKIWREYQEALRYQKEMGFTEDFPKFVKFREGQQWAKVTERTKNFPRPVFNITDMFIRAKRSAITNQPLTLTYSPLEQQEPKIDPNTGKTILNLAQQGAEDYTDYSKVLWENLDQDTLNNEFVDDSLLLGTGILHYFWDTEARGTSKNEYIGEVAGETIDPLNFFVANPQCKKIQKQPWIIISSNIKVKEAKQMIAQKYKISQEQIDLINPENVEENYLSEKQDVDDEKVTILTKYFKKNGEVYFSKSLQNIMIVNDQPLTPIIEKETTVVDENIMAIEHQINTYKMKLYPIVLLSNKPRKKCIFGIGEAQDIITINKLYNQLKGMVALNAIQSGNPIILVKPNALKQQITNEGGQIITDYSSNGVGDGIKYMQPPTFSNIFSQLSSEIFEMARTVSGVTDVSTGETMWSNMSASAIIALQNQAKTPIKEQQFRYYSAIKEVGDIWCEFYKAYYSINRNMSIEDENGQVLTKTFNGSQYADTDFKTKIDVGVSSEQQSLVMTTLDALKNAKDITKEQYIELAPREAIPYKEQLKDMWQEEKKQQISQMQQMIRQQQISVPSQEQVIQKMNGGVANEMQGM